MSRFGWLRKFRPRESTFYSAGTPAELVRSLHGQRNEGFELE